MKRFTLVAVLLLCMSAIAAAADDVPKAEIFGGYSFLRLDTGHSQNAFYNLNGWDASATFNVNKNIGLVADFGGAYGTIESTVDTKVHSFLFGPKFAVRKEKVTPFAQALFGVVNAKHSVGAFNASQNDFGMAIGGGLDINAGKKIAIRIAQAEYLMTTNDSDTFNHFRFSAGIVLKLGKR
jgi:opacity protein-like surface antigen